jgi:hypothetical protein
MMRVRARFEVRPQDCWIGLRWRRRTLIEPGMRNGTLYNMVAEQGDIWLCLVPMLPLHIAWYLPLIRYPA